MYRQYSFNFIPPLGQILAGDRESYQYLIESIERFPTQPQFARMIREAGFELPGSAGASSLGFAREAPAANAKLGDEDVAGAWEDLTLGIATIWTGRLFRSLALLLACLLACSSCMLTRTLMLTCACLCLPFASELFRVSAVRCSLFGSV